MRDSCLDRKKKVRASTCKSGNMKEKLLTKYPPERRKLHKIALLTDGIHPIKVGGIQLHSTNLIKYLSREGIKVDVFHPDTEIEALEALFSEKERANIQFHLIPYPRQASFPGHYIWESWLYSKEIWKGLAPMSEKVDLVYAQGFTGWESLRQLRHQKKTLVNLHGMEMFQPSVDRKSRWVARMLRFPAVRQIEYAAYVQSLGGELTDILLDKGVDGDRILEIPIGIDKYWLSPLPLPRVNEEKRKFIFVGRYERRKGIEELMPVLKQLQDERGDFSFDFIGPIPSHLHLDLPGLRYHGMVKDKEKIRQLLREADILVLPSHSEGMPTVILEAMACGCAVIATSVGAVGEQVDETCGWVIPSQNIPALKMSMEESLDLPTPELEKKQEMAVNRVKEKFLWEAVVGSMIDHFEKLINQEDFASIS